MFAVSAVPCDAAAEPPAEQPPSAGGPAAAVPTAPQDSPIKALPSAAAATPGLPQEPAAAAAAAEGAVPLPTTATTTTITTKDSDDKCDNVVRVAVLMSSYLESTNALGQFELQYEDNSGPSVYFAPRWPPAKMPQYTAYDAAAEGLPDYRFELTLLHKRTAYAQVRALVYSGKYDCFFNLCDGARDEDRAGIEVAQALEEFGVPFTGSRSWCYEPSKVQMKAMLAPHGVRVPRSAVVTDPATTAALCAHLAFPVIVKHPMGYGSLGMTKKSKCANLAELEEQVAGLVAEYQAALVEEFIAGGECVVFACADPTSPDGIRVYPPFRIHFSEGEDFKHMEYKFLETGDAPNYLIDPTDPLYAQAMEVGRVAFREIMGGVGYGRCDLRIDSERNEIVFLEINPNNGVLYPPGDESSADRILMDRGANGAGHREFVHLQIQSAMADAAARRPACVLAEASTAFGHAVQLVTARPVAAGERLIDMGGRVPRRVAPPSSPSPAPSGKAKEAAASRCDVASVFDEASRCWIPMPVASALTGRATCRVVDADEDGSPILVAAMDLPARTPLVLEPRGSSNAAGEQHGLVAAALVKLGASLEAAAGMAMEPAGAGAAALDLLASEVQSTDASNESPASADESVMMSTDAAIAAPDAIAVAVQSRPYNSSSPFPHGVAD